MFPPPHPWTMDTLCVVIEQKTISGWCRWLELPDGLLQCQASTHQNQFAYEVRSQSVKAFLSYSTETILGWCCLVVHLVPIFNTKHPLTNTNPHTNFEVNRSKHSGDIQQKPFQGGAAGWCHLVPIFNAKHPLTNTNPQTNFEVNLSKHSCVIQWKPF